MVASSFKSPRDSQDFLEGFSEGESSKYSKIRVEELDHSSTLIIRVDGKCFCGLHIWVDLLLLVGLELW